MFRYTEVLRWIVLRLVYLNYSRCSLCFFSGQRMKDIKCHEDSWLRSWGRSKVITGDEPGGGKPKSEFICGKFPLISGCGRLVKILEWYWLMVIRSGTCVHAYIYIWYTYLYIYIYIFLYTYTSYIEIHLPAFLKCQSFPGILRVATRHLESTGGEKDFRLPQGGGKGSSLGLSFLTMGVSTLNKKRCWMDTFPTSLVLGRERI